MKRDALRTLVCPLSKAELQVVALEEIKLDLTAADLERCDKLGIDVSSVQSAIKEGVLFCDESRKWYPIVNFVPVLLDFPTGLHKAFFEKHSDRTSIFAEYNPPDAKPRPGEVYVQRSFTKEWELLELDRISFGLTPEQRDQFIQLELDWPPGLLDRRLLDILEVGCGSGFETTSLARVTKARITGVDLNLSLLRNGHVLAPNPSVNVAVASLFALPVRPASFDIVYSSGVLHHTHSTKLAFDTIFAYRKPDGLIYIWVYAREDVDYSIPARIDWIMEEIFRPKIAKLPDFWQGLIIKFKAWRHFRVYSKVGGYNREKWTLTDSEHSMRDRWTALYAHRHSFNEVIGWFLEKDLEYRLINPRLYRERLGCPLIGIGIRGVPRSMAPEG